MAGLVCRTASYQDRDVILGLRDDVYGGSDYLPSYLDFYLQDTSRVCLVGELDGQMVGFSVLFIIDGGTSYVLQAGRVRRDVEGRGVLKLLLEHGRNVGRNLGCVREVSMCNTMNKHIYSTRYKATHRLVHTKRCSRYLLTDEVFNNVRIPEPLQQVNEEQLRNIILSNTLKEYLFPEGRILVDLVTFRLTEDNVSKLHGLNTKFVSNVTTLNGQSQGLLSAFTCFPVKVTAFHSLLDVYGSDVKALEDHVMYHILNHRQKIAHGLSMTIVVDTVAMASEARAVMAKHCMSPWQWDADMDDSCFYDYESVEYDLLTT